MDSDNVLLGFRKSLSPTAPDVDFRDVFGGPPRRSSMQDWRRSRSHSHSHSGEEEASAPTNPWSGLSEKPVFGEEASRLKKYPSDDFFDDIFRGDDSSNSTPRKLSRDPFSSASPGGSRLGSPSRSSSSLPLPLPLPPMISLPVKVGKEMDSSAFVAQSRPRKNKETALIGHPSSPGASSSRFSIQVIQAQDGSKNDSKFSYRQSSLSKENSLNDELIQSIKIDKNKSKDNNEEDPSSSEVSFNNNQFHFSIYKWPSTVVPVLMLPRREGSFLTSKESSKPDSVVTGHTAKKEFSWVSEENKHDNSVLSTKAESIGSVESGEEVVSVKPEPKPLSSFQNIFRKVQGNLRSNSGKDVKKGSGSSGIEIGSLGVSSRKMPVFKKEESKAEEPLYCLLNESKPGLGAHGNDNHSIENKEKGIPIFQNELPKPDESLYCLLKEKKNDLSPSSVENNLFSGTEKKAHIINKEAPKAEEPLYCLLKAGSVEQGNVKVTDKVRAKKGRSKNKDTSVGGGAKDRKAKKQTEKRNNLVVQETPDNSEDKPLDNKVNEKVKDFIKNYSQEIPSKSLSNVERRDQGVTVTATGPAIEEDQTTVRAAEADQSNTRKIRDNPGMVDQSSMQFTKPQRQIKTVADIGIERNSSQTSFSETVVENIEISVDNVEESFEDLDCTVQELTNDQNNQPPIGQNYEELQASDAKIRKWSNGKEGNIRSLLSTLQYVLWSGSGWKPVPLVDIIEGSSVRRAYQKALLCLHPDKLQQKGAAPHQKYIAEKVFDILQEAWTHFNSLGSL